MRDPVTTIRSDAASSSCATAAVPNMPRAAAVNETRLAVARARALTEFIRRFKYPSHEAVRFSGSADAAAHRPRNAFRRA
jgi:hypothetical protein